MKIVASLTTLALLGATATAHAQEAAAQRPVDVAATPETTDVTPVVHYPPPLVRLKLIGFGLLITGAAWGAAFGSGRNWPTVPGSRELQIPVVGPWIALGKSGCASDDPGCSGATVGVRGAMYVLDGIAQIAGLALITEAIVMKTESPPQKKSAFPGFRLGGVEVSAVPVTSPTMKGIGLVGTF
jgi:hypothetical protein